MKTSELPHPSWQELASFDRGQLSDDAWTVVERHVSGCETCSGLLDTVPQDGFMLGLRPTIDSESAREEQANHLPSGLVNHARYRILEPLGTGGMGAVFKAEHLLMGRLVAVKVLRPDVRDRKMAIERLAREVKALAKLSHPNLVSAFDAEQCGDALYVVMEYVEGETLDRIIRRCGRLPVAIATNWIGQAALGLQYAFEHGLIHRDLKPSNLLITPHGQVKILDFGLARCVDEDANQSQTPDGSVLGTPAYVAPEQARAPTSADIRADLYSLGCTWYEMLTGVPPLAGGTALQQLLAHQDQTPRPASQYRGELPAAADAIFNRLLAKDPAKRFQTPVEFLDALRQWEFPASDSQFSRDFRWFWPTLIGMAVIVLVALGLGGWQLLRHFGAHEIADSGRSDERRPELQKVDPRRPHGSVIAGWGNVVDPDGDSTISEESGVISIIIPGTLHGINPAKARFNAPRILSPIEGNFQAFVRVSGDFTPNAPSTSKTSVPFIGAGLLLYADDNNMFWIARNRFIGWPKSEDLCFAPLFELFQDGKLLNTNPVRTPSSAYSAPSTLLRLERKGDVLRGAFSNDGTNWEGSRETRTRMSRKVQIGVVAASTSSRPFCVRFAEFKLLAE